MPTEMTINYVFGGPVAQDIYDENEMAAALDISVDELTGKRGDPMDRPLLSCHAHPAATGGMHLYNRQAYTRNLVAMNRMRWLRARGEWDEVARMFIFAFGDPDDDYHRRIRNNTIIATEAEFLHKLGEYRVAVARGDESHHWTIRDLVK